MRRFSLIRKLGRQEKDKRNPEKCNHATQNRSDPLYETSGKKPSLCD
jgi:hypothetical protein